MKADIAQKWIEALESGERKQGTGFLQNRSKEFCCWGVLCDLHAKETGSEWSYPEEHRPRYLNSAGEPPTEVLKWAGIPLQSAYISILIMMNDVSKKTFKQIAEYIRNHAHNM